MTLLKTTQSPVNHNKTAVLQHAEVNEIVVSTWSINKSFIITKNIKTLVNEGEDINNCFDARCEREGEECHGITTIKMNNNIIC